MTSNIEAMCAAIGLKMTPQRRIIARVLSESSDHPGVEDLYIRANIIDPNISLATVYRTISIFEANGLVKKLTIGDGKARYELSRSNEGHHHHLINVNTGEIIEFVSLELDALKEQIAHNLGYKLVDYKLELYGIPLREK